MNFADYKARIIKYTKASLAAKDGIEGVKVVQSEDGTVSTEPNGVITPLTIEPAVLDSLAEGMAKTLVEVLLEVEVDTSVNIGGAQPGVAVLQGKGKGTLK